MWPHLLITAIILIYPASYLSSCNFDPISYFLNNEVINVPNTDILVSENNYLHLRDTSCRNINYSNIVSSYEPELSLSVTIDGITVACMGDYTYTFLNGKVKSTVSKMLTSVVLAFNQSNHFELPNGLAIHSCKIPKIIVDVSFTGGIGKNILNMLTEIMKSYIEDQIKKALCMKLMPILQANITHYLQYSSSPVFYSPFFPSSPPPFPQVCSIR